MQLNHKKTNDPIKKWAEELNRHSSKEETQLAKRCMNRCSTSLTIRETQMKIAVLTVRYLLIPARVAIAKKIRDNKCYRECGEKGTLVHCWWEIN